MPPFSAVQPRLFPAQNRRVVEVGASNYSREPDLMKMAELRYDGQVVVVTGAGSGLGREYAKYFGKRGAKVVVNDLGGSVNGLGSNSKAADLVVEDIKRSGGVAVPNYDSVEFGDRIIDTAIKTFGRVDILVNNAGILRDITLRNMKDEDWDLIIAVHLTGTFRTTRAAWPFFRKQRFGRVINTSSSSGLYGNFGQSNYAAAKLAIVGFTETLAKEGAKYNILANAIAPGAASRMTQTVMPPEALDNLKPDWVVPLVGVLTHKSSKETGSVFEAAAGHFSKIRWQRSKGLQLRPDDSLTAGALLKAWPQIGDFSQAESPRGVANIMDLLNAGLKLPPNPPGEALTFQGKVVLVTGGGEGLGRAYAQQFAKYGAKVAVNDLSNAEEVAAGIKSAGGEAIAVKLSVENGDAVIKSVTDAYGRIDIIVNNAGILRDKAFANMTDDLWFPVLNVHLRGTYKVIKAAWPHMLKQKYGRIVNITSTSGIYGNFGQSNYAAAKCGIIGFSRTLAREGAKYNILVNCVAPSAGTNMTRTVRPEEEVQALKPEFVAPLVLALCSDRCPDPTGGLYEAGCGWFAKTRWERARGVDFPHEEGVPAAEAVFKAFPQIVDFNNGQTDSPEAPSDSGKYSNANIARSSKAKNLPAGNRANRKFLSKIQKVLDVEGPGAEFNYSDRDVILYNLGVGAKRTDLSLVYEGSDNFAVLPTFGVIPTYFAKAPYNMAEILPNFNYKMLLHGEQYLEIRKFPIPTHGKLISSTKLVEVVDKGNAALVRRANTTIDAVTKEPVFYNESVSFIRGAGGFGGSRTPSERGAATALNTPPKRNPDLVVEEKTNEELAVLYRLLGDRNPLHVDPKSSAVGGFKVPILHGLATFGVSGKHVYQSYGPFKNIKVRFSGPVLPGETIVTEMWKENNKIVYQVKVKETGKVVISNAAAELVANPKSVL